MTRLDRLGGILQEVEAPLGRALKEHSPYLQLIDSDLQLSYSQCAIATAAVQLYLAEQCDVATHRVIGPLSMLSAGRALDDPVKHVLLSAEDGRVIDPTYTQFFELVGLNTRVAQEFPETKMLLPERKIALFKEAEELEFGHEVAIKALSIREKITSALAGRSLELSIARSALLRRSDEVTVIKTYQSIWQAKNYTSYTVESQAVAYGSDQFELCIRDIVDAI